jgi:hypothetical protein
VPWHLQQEWTTKEVIERCTGRTGQWQQEAGMAGGNKIELKRGSAFYWIFSGGLCKGRGARTGRADVKVNANDIEKLYCRVI